MTYRLVCDHCHQDILFESNQVTITYKIGLKTINRHYHKDCFNYKFSTDIERIKDNEQN